MGLRIERYKDTRYLVSEDGKVFSETTNRWLKQTITKEGYFRTHPHIDGKHTNLFVNRMVAEVFIPNPENKPFVLHNDNNPKNNHISNLRWGTQSENIKQAYNDNRISRAGELNTQAKISELFVRVIREAKSKGFKSSNIAKYFNVGVGCINGVYARRSWAHVN